MYMMHVFTFQIHRLVPKGAVPKGINSLELYLREFLLHRVWILE